VRALTHSDEIDRIVSPIPRHVVIPADYEHDGSDCDDGGCSPDCRYAS
jgi:hypothetical protein